MGGWEWDIRGTPNRGLTTRHAIITILACLGIDPRVALTLKDGTHMYTAEHQPLVYMAEHQPLVYHGRPSAAD